MRASVGWAPLQYSYEYVVARIATAGLKSCYPSLAQLLATNAGSKLAIPHGFLANASDALPLVEEAELTPVSTSCRASPAFNQAPFGNDRTFVCPISSRACEFAATNVSTLAARFYNLTRTTARVLPGRRSLARCVPCSNGTACANTLHELWACLHRGSDAQCEHLFSTYGNASRSVSTARQCPSAEGGGALPRDEAPCAKTQR